MPILVTQGKDDDEIRSLTEEELAEAIKDKGRKFGLMLAQSTLPDEVKESIMTILPTLTPEQMIQLADTLENAYAIAAQDDGGALEREIESILDAYRKRRDARDNDTLSELKKIEGEIDEGK